jgi:hypothetical protein
MHRKKFELWHSIAGLSVLVLIQGMTAARFVPDIALWAIIIGALAGAVAMLYVAMEAIEEVRNARRMLGMLSAIVVEFIMFFAIQYDLLALVSPESYPTLPRDGLTVLLHSVMIFVFNPLYLPADLVGRALLLINTAGALALVLFILQNIWQFRRES